MLHKYIYCLKKKEKGRRSVSCGLDMHPNMHIFIFVLSKIQTIANLSRLVIKIIIHIHQHLPPEQTVFYFCEIISPIEIRREDTAFFSLLTSSVGWSG